MNRPPTGLSESDYARFCNLVRSKSGLQVTEARRTELEQAVLSVLTETGSTNTDGLFSLLTARAGHPALESLIAAMTIGETHFFRNRPQFEALEQRILPDLIAQRRGVRRLRLWSAACASGEEPYSLAILLERLLPDLAEWNILILATDTNRHAL